jgi:hypothetical protein
MPITPEGVYYADNSTPMSVADITAAMADSISEELNKLSNAGIVESEAERDALYPTPIQGNTVFRTDLGAKQTYYAAWNGASNIGGKPTAGWYTENRVFVQQAEPNAANSVTPRINDLWFW